MAQVELDDSQEHNRERLPVLHNFCFLTPLSARLLSFSWNSSAKPGCLSSSSEMGASILSVV